LTTLRLDHVNIHTRDPARMIAFLAAVLDAKEGFRPPFPNPGHWLYLDGQPVIHLDVVDRDADFSKGLCDHIAFGVYEAATAEQRARASGFPLHFAGIPGADIGQIFVTGPEGLKIEIQFRRGAAEAGS
jgi:catechol 2,3-dioxygenase-like lactoylglutathione lyase family enzyme